MKSYLVLAILLVASSVEAQSRRQGRDIMALVERKLTNEALEETCQLEETWCDDLGELSKLEEMVTAMSFWTKPNP